MAFHSLFAKIARLMADVANSCREAMDMRRAALAQRHRFRVEERRG
jgi:hypothetical protein